MRLFFYSCSLGGSFYLMQIVFSLGMHLFLDLHSDPKACFIEMVSLLNRLQQLGRVLAGSSLHFNVKFWEPLGRLTPAA